MQKGTPLTGHLSLGSWNRLVLGVPAGRRKVLALRHLLRLVIVEPSLPGFKTGGNGVTCFPKMLRGVLTGRAITTSDVSTLGASAQVEPPPARSKALLATLAAGLRSRINSARLRFHVFPPASISSGSPVRPANLVPAKS